jgi:hypothetical protein
MIKIQFALLTAPLILLAGCIHSEDKTNTKTVNANGVSVPVNQTLTPAGIQVELTGARPQVICVSPDCQLLATSAKNELVLLNSQTGQIVQRVALPR